MTRWKNTRFRTKLFLFFILLSTIPSLFIGTTAYRKSAEMLENQTRQDLNVILGQVNTAIERAARSRSKSATTASGFRRRRWRS
ncbi:MULTISPECIES: hypothetical protein [Cohnella]|uniref:hypothetical protein n=1 Tax=Cohnella TaxID=329857 RepID=UPI001592E3A2|nr:MULTISPECIES: hypothetical protein [Cohnella]MBN2984925.1 hypothetical protein [Cohnella algarum]